MPFQQLQQHPAIWLDDGNVVISSGTVGYKVHKSMLCRLSPFFVRKFQQNTDIHEGVPLIRMTNDEADQKDLETFLQYLYHDKPLSSNSSFPEVASLLRISTKLEFSGTLELSRQQLREIYALRPTPFECMEWSNIPEACQLALDYNLRELLPSLLYAMIVTTDFDVEEYSNKSLPMKKNDVNRLCSRVMHRIVDYFTPAFFTVPTGSHMECTEILAANWMMLAIQPAIETGGVYKPLETLRKVQDIDWKSLGLCDECCKQKIDEWEEESDNVWINIQKWIDIELAREL